MVVDLFDEGGCRFAGEGVKEGGYGGEFVGFIVVYPFDAVAIGKEIEEDEELFF